MVVECSFVSSVTKFRLLGKAIETNARNSVHVVKAITLLHSVIKYFEGFTQLHVLKFAAAKADPRAYMPPLKRNNTSSREAVFAGNKFCRVFKLRILMHT
jgi:hypothetical protein